MDQCARGYLLYLIGYVLFPHKTKTKVSLYYLEALNDMMKVGEIAWEMAILAYTYHQLGLASRAGVRTITGCLTLVVVYFICYYFYLFHSFRIIKLSFINLL